MLGLPFRGLQWLHDQFAQLPALPPGSIESWLLPAAAVATIVVLGIKLFVRKPPLEAEFVTKEEFRLFRTPVERELTGLRDRIDSRHLQVLEALDKLRADLVQEGERRAGGIHKRLNDVESGLARVDERTRGLA